MRAHSLGLGPKALDISGDSGKPEIPKDEVADGIPAAFLGSELSWCWWHCTVLLLRPCCAHRSACISCSLLVGELESSL